MKFKSAVKSGLNIIIVGCGKVGNALVRQLSKEGLKEKAGFEFTKPTCI